MRAFVAVGLALALVSFLLLRAAPREAQVRATEATGQASIAEVAPVVQEPRELAEGERVATRELESAVTTVPERVEAAPEPALDPVQCVLHGRVRAEGARFASRLGGNVVLQREGEQRIASIGPEGRYSLAGVAPGAWTVQVQRSGYRELSEELRLALDVPILRRDFELVPSWLLSVRVLTPAGEPYGEALAARARATGKSLPLPMAVATKEPPGATIPGAEERNGYAGDGVYHTWDDLGQAAGEPVLEVLAEPPVHVSLVLGETVLETQLVEAEAEEVRFVLDPEASDEATATLKLRLVSSVDRRPIEQADVWINEDSLRMVRGAEWRETFAPGKYELAIRSRGHASRFVSVTLAAGELADLGELELDPEVTIRGQLVDGTGRPWTGLLEIGSRTEQGRLRFVEDYHYSTDEDGTFRIIGLSRGLYVLRSVPGQDLEVAVGESLPELWVLPHTPVSTLGGSVEGLQLTLVRAGVLALRGMSKWPEGSQCKLLDAAGDLAAYDGFYPGYTPRFALPPGSYTLIVCDRAWQELRRFPVVLDAGVVELDLEP